MSLTNFYSAGATIAGSLMALTIFAISIGNPWKNQLLGEAPAVSTITEFFVALMIALISLAPSRELPIPLVMPGIFGLLVETGTLGYIRLQYGKKSKNSYWKGLLPFRRGSEDSAIRANYRFAQTYGYLTSITFIAYGALVYNSINSSPSDQHWRSRIFLWLIFSGTAEAVIAISLYLRKEAENSPSKSIAERTKTP